MFNFLIALFSLGLITCGIVGITFNVINYIHKNGLLGLLPTDAQELLLYIIELFINFLSEKSFIEVIAEGKFPKKIAKKLNEILPIFLAKNNYEREQALENLTDETQRFFTTKGYFLYNIFICF